MATRKQHSGKPTGTGQDIADMARAIFDRVRDIKEAHPEVARRIDEQERIIRAAMQEIRRQIGLLDRSERDLVSLLVAQGIQKSVEDVFSAPA